MPNHTPLGSSVRELLRKSSSEEFARVNRGNDDEGRLKVPHPRPLLSSGKVITTVRTLQEKKPKGVRFAEILKTIEATTPGSSETQLRRELASILRRAVKDKILHRDLSRKYTFHRGAGERIDGDVTFGPCDYPRRFLRKRSKSYQRRKPVQ